jgi:hypothetical protein
MRGNTRNGWSVPVLLRKLFAARVAAVYAILASSNYELLARSNGPNTRFSVGRDCHREQQHGGGASRQWHVSARLPRPLHRIPQRSLSRPRDPGHISCSCVRGVVERRCDGSSCDPHTHRHMPAKLGWNTMQPYLYKQWRIWSLQWCVTLASQCRTPRPVFKASVARVRIAY